MQRNNNKSTAAVFLFLSALLARNVLAQAKVAILDKPIRYVICTHAHFKHTSGLRAFDV